MEEENPERRNHEKTKIGAVSPVRLTQDSVPYPSPGLPACVAVYYKYPPCVDYSSAATTSRTMSANNNSRRRTISTDSAATDEHVSKNTVALSRLRKSCADSGEELQSLGKLLSKKSVTATDTVEDRVANFVKGLTSISSSCTATAPRGVGEVNGKMRQMLGQAVDSPGGRRSSLKNIYADVKRIYDMYDKQQFSQEKSRLESIIQAEILAAKAASSSTNRRSRGCHIGRGAGGGPGRH